MTDGLTWYGLVVLATEWLIRIALAVRVILRRTPMPTTLSWLIVLLFVPVIGLFAYALVGEPRLGSRRVRRYEELTRQIEEQASELWRHKHVAWTKRDEAFQHLSKLGTTVSGLPPLGGNRVELLSDATDVLAQIARDIDAATAHVHMLFYIWMPTGKSLDVCAALERAARRGVECRVLVDAVGSKEFVGSEPWERMVAAGVRCVEALPVNPLRMLLARIDLRNHRKIAVIDGRVAYSGSQNLTDETFTKRGKGPWIDTTLRIEGPAAQALQTVFLRDWSLDSGEVLPDIDRWMPDLGDPGKVRPPGDTVVHVIPSGPGPQPDAVHQAFLAMLFAAREEIIMTTPYFVPDEGTRAALVNAALRGVAVTIILPDELDAPVVAAAGRSHYDDLLAAGVTIAHHVGGLLHAKTATIDRRLAVVGSANFDVRSFWLNFETTMFIYDRDFAGTLRFLQRSYLDESQALHLAEWRARPAWRRFLDNSAQLLSPLL
ncbi:MAG: cardiolipin synthase [Phycisphaerales bacterium]|nr:cardiolipin synthase [Phycisphaerales bacterium]